MLRPTGAVAILGHADELVPRERGEVLANGHRRKVELGCEIIDASPTAALENGQDPVLGRLHRLHTLGGERAQHPSPRSIIGMTYRLRQGLDGLYCTFRKKLDVPLTAW